MSECWTELNIWPAEGTNAGALLPYVTFPLMTRVSDSLDRWHFFWESQAGVAGGDGPPTGVHLRLRFRWLDENNAAEARPRVASFLDDCDRVGQWYEGAHGVEGEVYTGETEEYGELWPAAQYAWEASSDFVLQLTALGAAEGTAWEDLTWPYIDRLLHFVINQFGFDDVSVHLRLAHDFMALWPERHEGSAEMVPVLEAWRDRFFSRKPKPGG